MTDERDYIPANIAIKLFEQSQKAIEANTQTIKEMTVAVNELTKVIALPPTNKDILEEVKEHETASTNRIKDVVLVDEKTENGRKETLKVFFSNLLTEINTIKTDIKSMKSKIITMITVVCVAFSLLTISWLYVNNAVNTNIKNVVKEVIKEYNTTHYNNGVKK